MYGLDSEPLEKGVRSVNISSATSASPKAARNLFEPKAAVSSSSSNQSSKGGFPSNRSTSGGASKGGFGSLSSANDTENGTTGFGSAFGNRGTKGGFGSASVSQNSNGGTVKGAFDFSLVSQNTKGGFGAAQSSSAGGFRGGFGALLNSNSVDGTSSPTSHSGFSFRRQNTDEEQIQISNASSQKFTDTRNMPISDSSEAANRGARPLVGRSTAFQNALNAATGVNLPAGSFDQQTPRPSHVSSGSFVRSGSAETPVGSQWTSPTTWTNDESLANNSQDVGQRRSSLANSSGRSSSAAGDVTSEDYAKSKADSALLNKILHNKLVQIQTGEVNVVYRSDPKSPLYSVKTFEELHLKPELLKGVFNMGFTYPSKIQESALPNLLADQPTNMIAQSQSGTGKTAAFVLTMLSRINVEKKYPQALCLSPTYELALQTGNVVKEMGKYLQFDVAYAVRGLMVPRGHKEQAQIIIGTPGTVLDWITKYRCFDPKQVNVFVFDEADVMIAQQGHQEQSMRIYRTLGQNCQMLLFSATYEDDVMHFAETVVPDPIIIRLKREEESLDNIKQYYVECSSKEQKFQALVNIYGVLTIGQAMIFCRTRETASWLCNQMTGQGHLVGLLSGELTIEQRADIIQQFRDGHVKVLVTTNVSARGIDVEQVTIVVNFDLPVTPDGMHPDYETYLHRIGRTGRFGKAGIAINFIDGVRSRDVLHRIEEHFGKKISLLDTDDQDEIEKIAS